LKPGDPAYEELSKAETFIADESHQTPCDTFEKVCLGVAAGARFRFFVSATQMRNDGAEMLLKGITGPVIYGKPFRDLVEQGYLAKPYFKIFRVQPYHSTMREDPKAETRQNLYLNPYVNQLAAVASKSVLLGGRQTLVILEQFDQFVQFKNFLTVPPVFVHGGATKDVKEMLPKEYWECDIERAVDDFNAKKFPLLVGTSAASTGVDTKAAETVIYLQGGTLWVVDFRVVGSPTLERHMDTREGFYREMGDDVDEI
jgi:superfamily II DNA or RNA helicase